MKKSIYCQMVQKDQASTFAVFGPQPLADSAGTCLRYILVLKNCLELFRNLCSFCLKKQKNLLIKGAKKLIYMNTTIHYKRNSLPPTNILSKYSSTFTTVYTITGRLKKPYEHFSSTLHRPFLLKNITILNRKLYNFVK